MNLYIKFADANLRATRQKEIGGRLHGLCGGRNRPFAQSHGHNGCHVRFGTEHVNGDAQRCASNLQICYELPSAASNKHTDFPHHTQSFLIIWTGTTHEH